jgi:hypothetical protein
MSTDPGGALAQLVVATADIIGQSQGRIQATLANYLFSQLAHQRGGFVRRRKAAMIYSAAVLAFCSPPCQRACIAAEPARSDDSEPLATTRPPARSTIW